MIPQAVGLTLPVWAQAILALAAILANVGTFAFVIFVLWPSIRNQERRADKLEAWVGGEEGQRIKAAVISKIDKADGLDAAGKPADKKSWWTEYTDGDRSGL
jgi:Zn-dependent protease with chaperone function